MTAISEKVFGRDARLRKRSDFDYVRAAGRSAVGRYCVVQAAPPRDGKRRVAIVISRHYSRKAVDRNRARRLLREAYRAALVGLDDAWVVIRPRWRMKGIKLQPVATDFSRLLGDLRLRSPAAEAGSEAGRQ